MVIGLNRNGFETSLIHGAGTRRTTERVPPTRVRARQPVEKLRQVTISVAKNCEMPMIGHEAVRENADGNARLGLANQILERCVVPVRVEQPGALCAAVHSMKN